MTQKGRRLGRYRLEELLGQGGMAEVWRAADERLGRTVAVKVIHSAHLRDGHFRERFHREAQLVASLDHPNVLPVYDYGDEEGVPYLVMPYLDGGTLRDRMVGSPIPFAQAVSWIHQLGDALDAAHAAGILHRDVKPANVLIRRDDRLALADFGIAKMVESPTGLTATGMVVGTPIYMAPEQAQGKPATPASDRYALAVLAYELLSGKPPFDGESALALMHQHVTAPAPLLSSAVYGLPAGLDPVFEQALAKEPERRPPTCRAFARQLFAFVPTGTGVDFERATAPWARVDASSPTVYEATPKRLAERAAARGSELTSEPTISTSPQPTRRALFALAGAVAGVVLLAGAWFLVPRSRPDAGPARAEPVPLRPPLRRPSAPAEPPTGEVKVVDLPVPTRRSSADGPKADRRPAARPSRRRRLRAAAGPAPPRAHPFRRKGEPAAPAAKGLSGPPTPGSTRSFGAESARRERTSRRPHGPRRRSSTAAREGRAPEGSCSTRREGSPTSTAGTTRPSASSSRRRWPEGRDSGTCRSRRVSVAGSRIGGGIEGWELALGYGDARREAEGLLAKALAGNPADPRALLGRAVLHRMERRSADAIADATTVFNSNPPGSLGAAAASLIGDENASRRDWEEAVRWYRRAAVPQSPSTAHAGWEGGRILEEGLGRAEEARELYGAACRAGNRESCVKIGESPPRPRLFPGRRRP